MKNVWDESNEKKDLIFWEISPRSLRQRTKFMPEARDFKFFNSLEL